MADVPLSDKAVLAPKTRSYLAASSRFADGTSSPAAFLAECVDAVEKWEPKVHALTDLDLDRARESARESARRWQAGTPLSPIDGMPIGIKDVIDTATMTTEYGSAFFAGNQPTINSASVSALIEAGAVVFAKTATPEFAGVEPCGTSNPWDTRRTPGGSSSGSAAAVAAGMMSAALGTQVISSIIRPASYCGVYGFKPSFGSVNRGGSHDTASQSSQGIIAASLAECWLVLREISQRIGGDPGYPGLTGSSKLEVRKPRRVAFLQTAAWADVTPGARAAMEQTLEVLRAQGVQVLTRQDSPAVAAVDDVIANVMDACRGIIAWENRWPLRELAAMAPNKLAPSTLRRLSQAESMTREDYVSLLESRRRARQRYENLAGQVDVCLTLSAISAAPIGADNPTAATISAPSSYLAVPAISLPVLADEGMPLGLQVIGFDERDWDAMANAAWLDSVLSQ